MDSTVQEAMESASAGLRLFVTMQGVVTLVQAALLLAWGLTTVVLASKAGRR